MSTASVANQHRGRTDIHVHQSPQLKMLEIQKPDDELLMEIVL